MPDVDLSLDEQEGWNPDAPLLSRDAALAVLYDRFGVSETARLGHQFRKTQDRMRAGKERNVGGTQRRWLLPSDQPDVAAVDRAILVEKLLDAMPEHLWSAEVLSQADLSPLLSPVVNTEHGAQQRGAVTVNGVTFEPADQVVAGVVFHEQRQASRQILTDATATMQDGALTVDEQLNRWRSNGGRLVRQPGSVSTAPDGTAVITGLDGLNKTVGGGFDPSALLDEGGSQLPEVSFLTNEDLRLLFRTEMSPTFSSSIGGYLDDLAMQQEYAGLGGVAPGDQSRVVMETGLPQAQRGYVPGGASAAQQREAQDRFRGERSYNLNQALQLPWGMSRTEIKALSDKMKRAGIFAQVGGEPTVVGDPNDPAFKAAWRFLVGKSVQSGEPVPTILQESATAYEESLAAAMRVDLSDPARLRLAGDAMGRQLLGRKLTTQEQARLVETIHTMQRERAQQEHEMSLTDSGGELVEVDWEARMAELIRSDNEAEAGAHDVADQFEVFRGLLAGPGRGGNFQ